ncbi:unnamed protein product [Aphanomyces euteiches]
MSDSPPPPPPPPPPPASPREAAPPSPQPPPPNLSGPPRLGRSNSLPAPSSKLLAHQPLDAPDDLDRNWAWHFMMAQKHVPGEKDIEKWQAAEGFEKHTAMLYGLLTDNREEYWILLQKLWEGNESLRDKSFQGLVALIDVRFLRLIPPSRVNLLWFIEQCIQACFVVDTLLIVLMRSVDHSDSLAIQVTECAAALYAAKSAQVVSSGRELRRLAYDLREVPALAAMSKGLLDNPSLPLTPSKFLVCRLTFKMQEQLRFVMDKVLHVAAHRYQKWFQASFLHVQPYEGLIADIVRYVCAVHQPTSQAVEAKMTPRYHILGWLLLLNKSPAAKTRVLHAMFFDFLNYQAEVPIMHLEPAMMLLLKSTKNRNHPMVQDIVQFLVTHMDSSAKETAVSNAISALIKLGMMKNLQPLHDYLKEFNPALWTKCQQALPQHFNFSSAPGYILSSLAWINAGVASVTSSPSHSPVHTSSPLRQTPPPQAPPAGRGNSPQSSPQHASPKYSPKDSQPRLPSSSPREDQTNWTEQSFLEDQKLPIDTNPATVVIPETLASFRDQIASLQQSQSEVDKLIPALSVIFTAWSHLPNAIAISGELGGLLYKCLEKSFLTTTTLPHYVLDQCLQRPPQLYLPLLHGMYKQDSVLSARLLTYCCVHENLQPYVLFCEVLGVGDIPQAVLQDVPYAGNAVESTCLRTVPYLFQHAPPAYLPRTDSLVRALVGVATPNILSTLSMRLVLKEFAIFCDQTTTVLLSSLQWNSWEQTSVWELLAAEWEAKRKDKATVAALRKVLACLDPHVHGEALSGILRLLLQCTPDVSLLHCILKLSDTFDPFPSRYSLAFHINPNGHRSVLSIWIEKCFSTMQSFVVVMLQEPKDASDVCRQLNKLPENALVTDPDIRKAIQGYLNDQGTSGADLFPALSALVLTDDAQPPQPPPAKKPRVE